jgi:hypothetical protein
MRRAHPAFKPRVLGSIPRRLTLPVQIRVLRRARELQPFASVTAVSADGAMLATLTTGRVWPPTESTVGIHLYSVSTATTTLLPAPGPFDGSVYRSSFSLKFTPDASRLIALLGESAFSTPVAGGRWTQIVNDSPPTPHRGLVEFSGDSRIIGAQWPSQGFVVSVDGAPPRIVS